MSCVRRKLFKEGSNSWVSETIDEKQNNDEVENGSTQLVEYTVINEGDAAFKGQLAENPHGLKTLQENVFRRVASPFTEKDLIKSILIVHEGSGEELAKTWMELKQLQDMQMTSCYSTDVISVCTKEKFVLIFLEMSSVAGQAQKLCSTIRYNPSSLNRSVAIIGITQEGSNEDFTSHGLNDIIQLPVTEMTINKVLLKWAGHKSCEGLPLTPESPGDRFSVDTGSKASEMTKEGKEATSSLVNYNSNPDTSPSVQQGCNRIPEAGSGATDSYRLSQVQLSQAVPFYQQSLNSVQTGMSNGITNSNRSLTDLTQNHHSTNPSGLEQPTSSQGSSNIGALQHFVHSSNPHQDQQPTSLHLSRSAPDHYPVHGGLVPAHITNMVNSVFPAEHCNQGFLYHNIPSSDTNRQSIVPHFLPINPPPLYPSTLSPNTTGINSTHNATSKADQSPASTQISADCSSGKMVGSPAYMISGPLGSKDMKITMLHDDLSKHSSKERIRRERIKESCDQLRFLLPSVAGKKSDMASILEMTVKYVQMVKERLPPSVLQEISENIVDTSTVLPRKRTNRDMPVKQGRPRLTPTPNIHEGAPRLPQPLQPFYMRPTPFQAKAPTMVTTTGPMYVPHIHVRPVHEHPQFPMQQHLTHPSEPASFRPATSPPSAFNSCNVARNIRGVNVMQHIPPHDQTAMNLQQECNAPHTSFHSKYMYHGNQPVQPGGHSYDMSQQWSFLKLPAIGNIFHSLSSSNLSQGSSKQDSCESGTSSPTDSPLWESSGNMIGNRQDNTHLESPLMYKGTSI